jgi:orotate phosphoribosyltransferase
MELSPDFAAAKKEFLELLLTKKALKIASDEKSFFTFKSGRKSPNFINIGALCDGESQSALKRAYATAIAQGVRAGVLKDFTFIFGPAYKGITLAALSCEGLFELYGKNTSLLYDRKEAKNYGDLAADQVITGAGSWTAGSSILLVDDVITTGKAKYDALERLKALPDFKLAGLVLAVDRQELMGDATIVGDKSAVQAFESELGIKSVSVLTMQDIFSAVKDDLEPQIKRAWIEYYVKYGAVRLSE